MQTCGSLPGTPDITTFLQELDQAYAQGSLKMKIFYLTNVNNVTEDTLLRNLFKSALTLAKNKEFCEQNGLPWIANINTLMVSGPLSIVVNWWYNVFMLTVAFNTMGNSDSDAVILKSLGTYKLDSPHFGGIFEKWTEMKVKIDQLQSSEDKAAKSQIRLIQGLISNTELHHNVTSLTTEFESMTQVLNIDEVSSGNYDGKLRIMEKTIRNLDKKDSSKTRTVAVVVKTIPSQDVVSRSNESANARNSRHRDSFDRDRGDRNRGRDRERTHDTKSRVSRLNASSNAGSSDRDSSCSRGDRSSSPPAHVNAARSQRTRGNAIKTEVASAETQQEKLAYIRATQDWPSIVRYLNTEFDGMEEHSIEVRAADIARELPEGQVTAACLLDFCYICGLPCTQDPPHAGINCGIRSYHHPNKPAAVSLAKLNEQLRGIIMSTIPTHGAFRQLKGNLLTAAMSQLREEVEKELVKKHERQRRWVAEQAPKRAAEQGNQSYYGPRNNSA